MNSEQRQTGLVKVKIHKISGTYNENVLSFAGGLSKVADHPVRITINRQTTAKQ